MKTNSILATVNVVLLAAVLGIAWHSVSMRTSLRDAETTSRDLKTQLDAARAELKRIRAEARPALTIETVDPRQLPKPREDGAKLAPVLSTPPKFVHVLTAGEPSVSKSGTGLVATIPFKPASSKDLDNLALVVRLSSSAGARISRFAPVDSDALENVIEHINGSGTLAVFQGRFKPVGELAFQLEVSGPAMVDISGNFDPGSLKIDLK